MEATSSWTGWTKKFALLLATLAWTGLGLQLWLSVSASLANGRGLLEGVSVYLGFFTISTNLLVAASVTLPLFYRNSPLGRWFARPGIFGMAVTAILVVGVVYHVLLRDAWNPQGLQKVADIILHYLVPFLSVAFWILYPPDRVSWWWPLLWCSYPVLYFTYALIRGEMLQSYPYDFINLSIHGIGTVLRNAAGMSLVFLAAGAFVTWIAARKMRRSS